ncbi:putative receptor protein kinase zmpk1 [Quercus suber]|uniref:Receptor protein kinase zmpk1 n=1 Tax=Quercus suber TaxID=58331 RepID=A0AAW0IU61_QUESU
MENASLFFLLCLLQTLSSSASSKAFDTLIGTSLSIEKPSDKLVSANGEFSTGFYPVGDNAFCFAIWMTKPSVPTVVWIANRDDPVDGKGSKLSVLKDGKLHLTDSADSVVWKTKTEALTISEASNLQLRLMNTGNLVLYNFSSVAIWQSFDSSTDILLPQQLLTFGTSLVSNRGQGLYSSGYYKFFFDEDNVLHLLFQGPKLSSLYWPDPSLEDISNAGICIYNTSKAALLDDTGYFWSFDHFKFYATNFGTVNQRRLTLDTNGNLRLYSLQEMNGSWDWVVTWQAISDPCRIHGICGPNETIGQYSGIV